MKCERVKIAPPCIKLNSFLKLCGAASTGGHAKILISDGVVLVDGEPCEMRGKKLYPGARVEVDNLVYEVVLDEGE